VVSSELFDALGFDIGDVEAGIGPNGIDPMIVGVLVGVENVKREGEHHTG